MLLQRQIQHPECAHINEIKAMKKAGLCYKCRGPHLQCECTNNSNNKFQSKTTTQQMQKCNYTNKFANNQTSKNMFPLGTLSFQTYQPIRSSKDISVSIDSIKHFLGKLKRGIASRRSQKPSMTVHLHQKSL